ncbi:hypothetical protein Gorai_018704 [Gossypium raimondii]|uniref:Uncharacterized protein n=1 Tax=Gossypium raimondii TaxID=29730 RepID=A0A7J8PLI5_GOSRA|nr:hypothetical protein [Gossypium raimondii]
MHWLKKVQDSLPTNLPPPQIQLSTHLRFSLTKIHGTLFKPLTLTLMTHFKSSPSLSISRHTSKNRHSRLQRPCSPHLSKASTSATILPPMLLPRRPLLSCQPLHSFKRLPPLVPPPRR